MFMSPGKYTEEDRLFAGQECVPTPPPAAAARCATSAPPRTPRRAESSK